VMIFSKGHSVEYLVVVYILFLSVNMYISDLEYVDLSIEASNEAKIDDRIENYFAKDGKQKLTCKNSSNVSDTEINGFIWDYMKNVYDKNQDSFLDENEVKENLALLIK
jgi:hypothetical protein